MSLLSLLIAGLALQGAGEIDWELEPSALEPAEELGEITDMVLVRGTGGPPRVLVAGTCGVGWIDLEAMEVSAAHRYELPCPPFLAAELVDVDGDGTLEVVRMSTGWTPPTAVLELDGSLRWQEDMASRVPGTLDLDHDGKREFILGRANKSTVYFKDHTGKTLWSAIWNSSKSLVVQADTDGDGRDEIVYADGKSLNVVDADGKDIREVRTPRRGYINRLEREVGLEDGSVSLIVGEYADGWQYTHRYTPELVHVKEYKGYPNGLNRMRARLAGGEFIVERRNNLQQAATAGFSGSTLDLRILNEAGEVVFGDVIRLPEGQASLDSGGFVALEGPQPRFLLGYGNTILLYAAEG